jgi:uncharacterized phage-associated protein
MYKASPISDFFIAFSHEHGDPLTNLKLQKLIYYAQAWHLAIFDQPLFSEQIEAWIHGPVVAPEYRRFKGFAWQPIAENPAPPEIDETVRQHLTEVMDNYGGMTAYQLEQLTHTEDPWINARKGLPADEWSNAVISHDQMKNYYRARMNG